MTLPYQNPDRQKVAAWLRHNRWTSDGLNRAMRRENGFYGMPTARQIDLWIAREATLSLSAIANMRRFIAANPKVGDAEDFIAAIPERLLADARARADDMQRRRDEVERERMAWRREHLARERVPKVREHGPLFGLDKATVQALRGY